MEGVLEQVGRNEKKRTRVFGRVAGNFFYVSSLATEGTGNEQKFSLKNTRVVSKDDCFFEIQTRTEK
jgi:hypothetical protein